MRVGVFFIAVLSAAPTATVELRPLKKVTALPVNQCEVEVRFRLSVFDGGSEDYYCPRVEWEWEDQSRSSDETDCPPFDEGAPTDHRRTWTRSRAFHKSGAYRVKARLYKAQRLIRTIETTSVVTGWEGFPDDKRQEYGCSPTRPRGGMADDAAPLSGKGEPASESIEVRTLAFRLLLPGLGNSGSAGSVQPKGSAPGATQLTNPTTGITCTLMIVTADPDVDPKIQRQAEPGIDPGIISSASPCVRSSPP